MLNENEIRLVTAALIVMLGILEGLPDHPDIPAIKQLLLKLRQMRDAQAQG